MERKQYWSSLILEAARRTCFIKALLKNITWSALFQDLLQLQPPMQH